MNNRIYCFFTPPHSRTTSLIAPSTSNHCDDPQPDSYWLLLASSLFIFTLFRLYLSRILPLRRRRRENFSPEIVTLQNDLSKNNEYENIIAQAEKAGHDITTPPEFIDFYFRTIIQDPVYFIDENNIRTANTSVDRKSAMIIMQMDPKICPLTRKKIIGFEIDNELDTHIKAFIQSVKDKLSQTTLEKQTHSSITI